MYREGEITIKDLKLFDAEYRFICLVWEHMPVNSTQLVHLCSENFGWKKSTTYTMIKKLSQRGLVKNENTMVSALVKKEDIQKHESEELIKKSFNNSLPLFLTAFLQGKKLSKQEAEELKKMIEEAAE